MDVRMFKLCSQFIIVTLLLFHTAGVINAGDSIGEMGINGGVIFPQGNFVRYADAGPAFVIRANAHIPKFEAVSGWLDFSGALFTEEREAAILDVSNSSFAGELVTSQYTFSLHLGLQLGSGTRSGAIRPRVAIAPGIYYFSTETKFTQTNFFNVDNTLLLERDDQLRFGWRGVIGSDFFFSTKWGISFDFVYDQVWNLHEVLAINQSGQSVQRSQSARFNGYMIGVVIPFEANK